MKKRGNKQRHRLAEPARWILLLGAALLLLEALLVAYIWFETDGADAVWLRCYFRTVLEYAASALLLTAGGALLLDLALLRERMR